MRVIVRWVVGVLCAVASGLLAAPALAVREYVAATPSSFGEPGVGAGQFEGAEGVAVNNTTGNVYVVDGGNARVDEFNSTGQTFIRAWGWGVADGLPKLETCTLTCQKGISGAGAGEFQAPTAVAVDNSKGSSAQDVYVSDPGNKRVDKFSATGAFLAQITETKSGSPFGEVRGVAVDPSGNLWVSEANGEAQEGSVDEFSGKGSFLTAFKTNQFIGNALAADSSSIYVTGPGLRVLKFASGTGALLAEFVESVSSLAVDTANDNLLVDREGSVELYRPFSNTSEASAALLQTFAAGALSESKGVGVNGATEGSSGSRSYATQHGADSVEVFNFLVFPTVATGTASAVGETTATLEGNVTPEGEEITGCEFEYGPAAGEYLTKAPCSPKPPFAGKELKVNVTATLTGLEPRHTYHYRLTATNKNGTRNGKDESTFTVSKPLVENESVSTVGPVEARVGALLDAAGLPTTYRVEYDTTANFAATKKYTKTTSEVSLGNSQEPTPTVAELAGLSPGVEYHFRFVATNAFGTVEGLDQTFTTLASSSATPTLPDERAYEFVSNSGAEAYAPVAPKYLPQDAHSPFPFQVSASGESVTYIAEPAASSGNGVVGEGKGNQWFATRSSTGWVPVDIAPPIAEPRLVAPYDGFTSDLAIGFLADSSQPPLTAQAPTNCDVLYSRASTGTIAAQFTTTKIPEECGHPHVAGVSADKSQVMFESEAPLVSEAGMSEKPTINEHSHSFLGASAGEPCQLSCNLYDSTGGKLRIVNVLPGTGTTVPNATFGSGSESPPDFSNVVSTDGSRAFWTDTQPKAEDTGHIYIRENPSHVQSPLGIKGECTVPADACTIPVSAGAATYWTATPDGRYAFYTEGERLYRFDSNKRTSNAIVSTGVKSEGAGVLGVVGSNTTGEEAGAYIYFVATGVLASNENEHKEHAEVGADNFYLLHNGTMTFIARLAPSDDELSANSTTLNATYGDWQPGLGFRTAEVTPDGRHVVFESTRALTEYNNVIVGTSKPAVEVFVYSADTRQTVCTSCSPTGTAPQVEEGEEGHFATLLPVSLSDTTMRHWITEDGNRVFFESFQPLASQGSNGVQNVYEWERENTPSCPVAGRPRLDGGCIFLLSAGESADYSFLIDADPHGENVFFVTRAQLVQQDRNEKMDLYDARVHGGFPETSIGCIGTSCQITPAPAPVVTSLASMTSSGGGNVPPAAGNTKTPAQIRAEQLAKALRACRTKRNVHRRKACEAQARKRYAVVARKANRARTGSGRRHSGGKRRA